MINLEFMLAFVLAAKLYFSNDADLEAVTPERLNIPPGTPPFSSGGTPDPRE